MATAASGGALVNKQGQAVTTASALIGFGGLSTLPSMKNQINFAAIQSIALSNPQGGESLLQVTGYSWYNSTSMDLFLTNGYVLTIFENQPELHYVGNSFEPTITLSSSHRRLSHDSRRRLDSWNVGVNLGIISGGYTHDCTGWC